MRKISREASEAFWEDRDFKKSNTEVTVFETDVFFYLHGHLIARRSRTFDNLQINHCGWPTVATKDRLNAILSVGGYGRQRIYQKDKSWYISQDLQKDIPVYRGWNEIVR